MAKIKIQSVELKCNAQVIMLDANFVSRAVRTLCAIDKTLAATTVRVCRTDIDENGNEKTVEELQLQQGIDPWEAACNTVFALDEEIKPFISELVAAFEAE